MPRCQLHLDWDRNVAEAERWAEQLPVTHPNVDRPYKRAKAIQRRMEREGHTGVVSHCPDETPEEEGRRKRG